MPHSEFETEVGVEFSDHYGDSANGSWGGNSGPGSDAYTTIPYRAFLESFIRMNQIKSVVDVGCGDWQFSRFINFSGINYLGLDVVPTIIERNREKFQTDSIKFEMMPKDMSDIRSADLLIMKDVLQHLSDRKIHEFQDKLLGKFKYCLITNSYEKLNTPVNTDISDGSFRCLDLSSKPHHLDGAYVLEFMSPLWERIRTFLHQPNQNIPDATTRTNIAKSVNKDLIMLQTADPIFYRPLLEVSSKSNIKYCELHNIGYESYIGIKSGVAAWMASYNRMFMLDELMQRGHRGWVIFADADAFVADMQFDIRGYLADNSQYSLIGASGGSEAPWNINSGILFINLGDPVGRAFSVDWLERFRNEVPRAYLASPDSQWDEYPNDQSLMYDSIKLVPGLMERTKREDASVFNYHHGQFMRQAIRAGHSTLEDRIAWVADQTREILLPYETHTPSQ